jgi:hypothetical protein
MSEEPQREFPTAPEHDAAGVLANLPRTRPQRSSARRIAARDGAAERQTRKRPTTAPKSAAEASRSRADGRLDAQGASKASASGGEPRPVSERASTPRRRARAASARPQDAKAAAKAPRQGFESEAGSTSGPVSPPGGAEFLTAATELLTGLAKSGLSRGTATLKDVMERLRIS